LSSLGNRVFCSVVYADIRTYISVLSLEEHTEEECKYDLKVAGASDKVINGFANRNEIEVAVQICKNQFTSDHSPPSSGLHSEELLLSVLPFRFRLACRAFSRRAFSSS